MKSHIFPCRNLFVCYLSSLETRSVLLQLGLLPLCIVVAFSPSLYFFQHFSPKKCGNCYGLLTLSRTCLILYKLNFIPNQYNDNISVKMKRH